MDLNDVYLTAVDTALSAAGVTDRGAWSVANRIFKDHPALADVSAYVEALKAQMPAHFQAAPAAPAVEVAAVRQAVKEAHFLANLATLAGPSTPPAPAVEAPAPPTQLSRDDPAFPRLFATYAARIATGECEVR